MLITGADAQDQHRRFVERVVASRLVWALRSSTGLLQYPANADEARLVLPFWSDRAYAARFEAGGGAPRDPAVAEAIDLEPFLLRLLPALESDRRLVGTNWNRQGCGLEVEPRALLAELCAALPAAEGRRFLGG